MRRGQFLTLIIVVVVAATVSVAVPTPAFAAFADCSHSGNTGFADFLGAQCHDLPEDTGTPTTGSGTCVKRVISSATYDHGVAVVYIQGPGVPPEPLIGFAEDQSPESVDLIALGQINATGERVEVWHGRWYYEQYEVFCQPTENNPPITCTEDRTERVRDEWIPPRVEINPWTLQEFEVPGYWTYKTITIPGECTTGEIMCPGGVSNDGDGDPATTNCDESGVQRLWVPLCDLDDDTCGTIEPDVPSLLVQLPEPRVGVNPNPDTIVRIPTWFWLDNSDAFWDGDTSDGTPWRIYSASTTRGGVRLTMNASPSMVEFFVYDAGDPDRTYRSFDGIAVEPGTIGADQDFPPAQIGSGENLSLYCSGPGTRWTPARNDEYRAWLETGGTANEPDTGWCTYTYTRASIDSDPARPYAGAPAVPADSYRVEARVYWDVWCSLTYDAAITYPSPRLHPDCVDLNANNGSTSAWVPAGWGVEQVEHWTLCRDLNAQSRDDCAWDTWRGHVITTESWDVNGGQTIRVGEVQGVNTNG